METLFRNPINTVEQFDLRYQVKISEPFIVCANNQLSRLFELQTGLKIGKQISIAWEQEEKFFYEKGETSKLTFRIFVNHHWNSIVIQWKSKSGRIYAIDETDIDCDDIEFSFEHLDVAEYHKQFYPNDELPFKLKGLTYELLVTRLNMEAVIEMVLKKESIADVQNIITKINEFIEDYNRKVLKGPKDNGVVHNWVWNIIDDKLICDIDTGSAGPRFYKKLLPFLSKLEAFVRVEIA